MLIVLILIAAMAALAWTGMQTWPEESQLAMTWDMNKEVTLRLGRTLALTLIPGIGILLALLLLVIAGTGPAIFIALVFLAIQGLHHYLLTNWGI